MKFSLVILTVGTFSGAGLTFLTQVLLARALTPEEFGAFFAALSLVTLISPLAGFGVGMFWLKAFGEEGWNGLRWVKPSLSFTAISTVLAVSAVYVWAVLAPHDISSRNLLFVLSLYILGQVCIELVSAIFQLEERYATMAFWQFLPHAIRFILIVVLLSLMSKGLTAIDVAFLYVVTAGVVLSVGTIYLAKAYRGEIRLKGHSPKNAGHGAVHPSRGQVVAACWPFGLAGVFYLIYFQSSIVIVKYLLNDEAAAQYGVAVVLMTAIYLFPSVIYQKFLLPKIHRWANHDRDKLIKVYKNGNLLMLLLGVAIAAAVGIAAPFIIPLVFGDEYLNVVHIMMCLVYGIPFRFVATSIGSMLVTHEHMRKKVIYIGGSALASVFLSVSLIPSFGVIGAAYAAVITEALQLVVYYLAVKFMVFKNG